MTNASDTFNTVVISKTAPKRVLVVEDTPDIADTFQAMLASMGVEADIAPDGRDALVRFKKGKYDLVITDYSMPRMNGIELAEIIKRRSQRQQILMVTAYAFTIAAYDGRPLPVDFILRKPFQPQEFQDTLSSMLQPKKQAKPSQKKTA